MGPFIIIHNAYMLYIYLFDKAEVKEVQIIAWGSHQADDWTLFSKTLSIYKIQNSK